MTYVARLALLILAVPLLIFGSSQSANAAGTVVFSPGQATSVQDGKTVCVIATSNQGKGSVLCGGRAVYDALWSGTPCDTMTNMGCVVDGRIKAVRLWETGMAKRAWIEGVGGSIDVRRGQKVKAGKITGKHLSQGGFRFANVSGHGFTLTNRALVTG